MPDTEQSHVIGTTRSAKLHWFERHGNDLAALLLVCTFLVLVVDAYTTRHLIDGAVTNGYRPLIAYVVAVALASAWVFGPETLRAAKHLGGALFAPEMVPSMVASGPGESERESEGEADDEDDVSDTRTPGGGGVDRARQQMIHTQFSWLDVVLAGLYLASPFVVLFVRVWWKPPQDAEGVPMLIAGTWLLFVLVAGIWAFGTSAAKAIADVRLGRRSRGDQSSTSGG